MLFNLHISFNLYLVNGHKYVLAIKRTALLQTVPINWYCGILLFAQNEAVLILISCYTVFLPAIDRELTEWSSIKHLNYLDLNCLSI